MQSDPARRTSARLSAAKQLALNNDTQKSLRHFSRRSSRTITPARPSTNRSISKRRQISSGVTINSRKRRTFPPPGAPIDSYSDPQYAPQLSTQSNWFEALEILARNGNKFQVSWAGIDPSTGKQWEPTWVWRKDCTSALLNSWKMKYVGGKKESPPISIQSELPMLRSSTRNPSAITQIEKHNSLSIKQVLLEKGPSIKKSSTIPPRKIPRKRSSTLDIVIPAKRRSQTHNSRSPEPTDSKGENASQSTIEITSTHNESSVNHELTDGHQSELPTSAFSQSQVPINSTSPSSSVRPVWSNFTPIQTYWLRFAKGKQME